jgi:hypothetical protein
MTVVKVAWLSSSKKHSFNRGEFVKTKKTSTKSEPIKRCGVFDREKAKADGKKALDVLWAIAAVARADLSVTQYEAASYEASLQAVEQELHSLTLPPGTKAMLPDEMFG